MISRMLGLGELMRSIIQSVISVRTAKKKGGTPLMSTIPAISPHVDLMPTTSFMIPSQIPVSAMPGIHHVPRHQTHFPVSDTAFVTARMNLFAALALFVGGP